MTDPIDAVVVMQGPQADLERVARRLTVAGIAAQVVAPPTGSGSSWGTKLWLAVASTDAERCREIFEQDWFGGLEADQLEAAQAAAEIVIDPSAPETTCPACLTTFATGPTACPDCGLVIG